MIDRVAIDTAFLRVFCLGREDEEAIDQVMASIARSCPEAYDRALQLGPWLILDFDEGLLLDHRAAAAPSWLN